MDTDPDGWDALHDHVTAALLALPPDRTLELLVPGTVLTLAWPLPDRLLLHGPAGSGRWTDGGAGRCDAARRAAGEVVALLRDVLGVAASVVELWQPCVPGPPPAAAAPAQEPLW